MGATAGTGENQCQDDEERTPRPVHDALLFHDTECDCGVSAGVPLNQDDVRAAWLVTGDESPRCGSLFQRATAHWKRWCSGTRESEVQLRPCGQLHQPVVVRKNDLVLG